MKGSYLRLLMLLALMAILLLTSYSIAGAHGRTQVENYEVTMIALSGLYVAYRHIQTLEALFNTSYGRAVLAKSGLFGLLMVLGAVNLLVLSPRFARSVSRAVRWLSRTVRAEIALAILAFLLLLGCAPAINAINELSGRSQPLAPAQYRLPEPGMPAASPPPWAHLDLQGRLILIRYNADGYQLVEVDLSTGNTKGLFQSPQNSLLTGMDVSPDGSQIVLAYAAPPEDGQMQLGYTRLFVMASDGSSQPEPFLTSTCPDEAFYHPVWSPDGQHVYYTHLYRRDPDEPASNYRIEKVALSGEQEIIVEDAIWPGISPNGSKLAYLTFEPGASDNELYVMDMVQKETAPVITTGEFPTVDAHVFTPDGDQIYFSAVNTRTSGNSWFESIDGVDVAWDGELVAMDGCTSFSTFFNCLE